MQQCRVIAPAKINLSLDITGRRHDGYHFLSTVMQSIGLYDTLTITRSGGSEVMLTCDGEVDNLPTGADNLVVRAALCFFSHLHLGLSDAGVHIQLQKEIPMQAGLAGGSADAAAALVGLNALFDAQLDAHALQGLGLTLGADVPFCMVGGAVLAEGIGEMFQPLPSMPNCYIVIAKPQQGISTKEAYALFDLSPARNRPDNDSLAAAVATGQLSEIGRLMCNVFEEVCNLPEVYEIKAQMLAYGALGAQMTGSGSAVFGLFDEKSAAKRCMAALQERFDDVYLTKPCAHGAVLQ